MDPDQLNKYVDEGYVNANRHPVYDYYIYNYSPKTQFAAEWNEVTLNCRGLIVDPHHFIVARPFPKFFSYEQHIDVFNVLPQGAYSVWEKVDGSLGILYPTGDGYSIATRGSFVSEQALWATRKLYNDTPQIEYDWQNFTYLFEIIYPGNRIVVDYGGFEGLVLLDVLKRNGETDYAELQRISKYFVTAKELDVRDSIEKMYQHVPADQEGYVLKYQNGTRIKVKGEEYLRLHKIVTNVHNRNVWEYLVQGRSLQELIENVPDEFYSWVKRTAGSFAKEQAKIILRAKKHLHGLEIDPNIKSRGDFARAIAKRDDRAILFAMLDNRHEKAQQIAWQMVRPTELEYPFKEQ